MKDFQSSEDSRDGLAPRPPAFNVPAVVVGSCLLLLVVHGAFEWVADRDIQIWVIERFAFIPVFFTVPAERLPEPFARFISPFSYTLLHGSWTHLLVNLVWLLAFGSAVARRVGTMRFLALAFIGSACGAALHFLLHMQENIPMIGASAAISAFMGATLRFAFSPGADREQIVASPRLPLLASLRNRGIVTFVLIWFAINFVAGSGLLLPGGPSIAWEAHIGGFLLGWLGFALFDRPQSQPHTGDWNMS